MQCPKLYPLQALGTQPNGERSLTEVEGFPSDISSFLNFKATCIEFFFFSFNTRTSPCRLLLVNETSSVMEQRGRVPWEMVSQFEPMFKKISVINAFQIYACLIFY